MGVTLAITAAVGAGVNVAGTLMSANAKANADQQSAALKYKQADELMSREAINEDIMRTQEGRTEDQFRAASGSTGFANTGIGGVLRMRSDLSKNIGLSQRDAAFKAEMLRTGAQIDTNLASDERSAGYVAAAGSVLGGAEQVYSLYKKSSNPGKLYGG